MKITITGSLGNIGKPLTQILTGKGHTVTVISSKQEKKKDIEALEATAAIGSLEDVDFLLSVFDKADAVFAMVPPQFAEPDQVAYYQRIGNNYAKAVQQSGVKHIVYLSSYGADLNKDTGFILGAHKVENILDKLPGTAVTYLRAMYFYYNLNNFISMIKTAGFIGSNYGGDDRLVMVAPQDIAAATAEELEKKAHGKNIRYVASDEHTATEAARILGAAIGKPELTWKTLTNEQTLKGLKESGMPAHAAEMLTELGAAIHSGIMLKEYDLHKPAVTGKIKLEDFAKEFADAYNKN